jgi:hypothetical protein
MGDVIVLLVRRFFFSLEVALLAALLGVLERFGMLALLGVLALLFVLHRWREARWVRWRGGRRRRARRREHLPALLGGLPSTVLTVTPDNSLIHLNRIKTLLVEEQNA